MGQLPSHIFCLFKLSCLIKVIEGIKKASGEHIHQTVSIHSGSVLVFLGASSPAGTAQSIISHYADYHPLVLLSTGMKFKPIFVIYLQALHILDMKQLYNASSC